MFPGVSITQINGTGNNLALGTNWSDRIAQFGGNGSISLAFGGGGNDRFTIGGNGNIGAQFGGSGNDRFTVSNSTNGRYALFGGSGSDSVSLSGSRNDYLRYGNAFYNPATGTGVYIQGIQNVNFLG
jgi:hypothetical protein